MRSRNVCMSCILSRNVCTLSMMGEIYHEVLTCMMADCVCNVCNTLQRVELQQINIYTKNVYCLVDFLAHSTTHGYQKKRLI